MLSNILFFTTLIYLTSHVELASVGGQQVSKEKIKEATMILVNDCKEKVGASDDDIEVLKNKKMPTTPEGLCLMECFFNSARIMKNGKLSKQGAMEALQPALKGDQDKIGKLKTMIGVCAKEIGDGDVENSCNNAKLIVQCFVKHGADFGFMFPNPL